MTQDDFLDVIATEVDQDPHNLALREDFITLLLQSDPDRAARELLAFEAAGGDASRVRVLRARVMAARLREVIAEAEGSAPALREAAE